MPRTFVYQQSKIPSLNSAFGNRLAKRLWDLFLWFSDKRRDREEWVEECDAAYLCHRYVPDTRGIDLIEDGEFGESDIHDASNVISIRLALSLMPRNEPWLAVSSREDEADDVIQGLQDLQIYLHKKAKARRQIQRVIKQGVVRGTTYLHYDWEDHYRFRRMTNAENAKELKKFLTSQGLSSRDAEQFTIGRYKELIFSGPVVQPVDFYDVWLNPRVDIINERRPSYILRRFRFLSELHDERDDNNEKVYKNLKGLEPYSIEDLMTSTELAGGRSGSDRLFGTNRLRQSGGRYESGLKMVPVYMFYLPYFEFENYKFHDTYFYLAISREGAKPRLVRIEENANDLGINHLLIDHYVDMYTQEPYGISGVQYQVGKLRQKDFLQLLTVTALAHSIFPPNLGREGAFRDEDEVSFAAGYMNWVLDNGQPLKDAITPIEMPTRGTQLGEQSLRFWSEEIKAGTGADNLVSDNQARTLSKPKTATEINRDVSSGSFFLDNQAENLQDLLTEYVQGVYELSQVKLKPSPENPDVIEYEKYLGDKIIQSKINAAEFRDVRRSIQVHGVSGELTKEQDKQNLLKMFEVAGQVPDPRMTPIKMHIAQKLSRKLNVPIPEEFFADPVTLLAENPQIQELALQNAMQNPEIQQFLARAAQALGGQGGDIGQSGEVAQGTPINATG